MPWIGAQRIERYVTFGLNCEYDSAPYNADDVNKLFGLSFGVHGVHWNSARFGWRWSKSAQCIEVLAYIYDQGHRLQDEELRFPVVAQIKLGERVKLGIEYDYTEGSFTFFAYTEHGAYLGAYGVVGNAPKNLPRYGLTCGLYFGGTLTAPHEISVEIGRT